MSAAISAQAWTVDLKDRLSRLSSPPVDLYPGTPAYKAQRDLVNVIESTWRSHLLSLVRSDLQASTTGRRKHYWADNGCLIVYELKQGASLAVFGEDAAAKDLSAVVESKREEILKQTVQHELYILTPQFSTRNPTSPPAVPESATLHKSELKASLIPSQPSPPGSSIDKPAGLSGEALSVPRTKVQRHSFSDSKGASDIKALITGRAPSASFTMPASSAYTIIGGARGSVKVLDTKTASPVPEVAIELEAEDDDESSEGIDTPLETSRPASPSRRPSFRELNAFPLGPKDPASPVRSPSVRFADLPTFEDDDEAEPEVQAEIMTAARAPIPTGISRVDPYAPLHPAPSRPRVPLSLDTSTYTVPPRPSSPTPRFLQHTNNLLLPLPVQSPTATSHSLVSLTQIPQSILRTGLFLPRFISSSVGGLFFSSLGSVTRPRSASTVSERSVGGTRKGVFGTVAGLIWGGWGKGDSTLLPTTERGLASLVQTSAAAGGAVAGRGF